jgi:hypothetical protein
MEVTFLARHIAPPAGILAEDAFFGWSGGASQEGHGRVWTHDNRVFLPAGTEVIIHAHACGFDPGWQEIRYPDMSREAIGDRMRALVRREAETRAEADRQWEAAEAAKLADCQERLKRLPVLEGFSVAFDGLYVTSDTDDITVFPPEGDEAHVRGWWGYSSGPLETLVEFLAYVRAVGSNTAIAHGMYIRDELARGWKWPSWYPEPCPVLAPVGWRNE